MAKVTFDGDALLIISEPGLLIVDIKDDVYSEWKDWQLLIDNMKYPQLFRTVGGDPLTPGIDMGAYYFIQNQDGWRWRPAEEDATVLVTGNLAPEDSAKPILIPTLGDYSVLYQGLQPITQSVESIFIEQQNSAYNGEVVVDFIYGTAGTAYPIGLESNPVDNVIDAFIIANNKSFRKFSIRNGTFNLDRDAPSYIFEGGGGNNIFQPNGYNVSGSRLQTLILSAPDFTPSYNVSIIQCNVSNGMQSFQGNITQSGLDGTIVLKPGASFSEFSYSSSASANGHVSFHMNTGGTGTQMAVKSWSGSISLHNLTDSNSSFSLDAISAKIHIESDCTDGTIILRGIGDILDENTGSEITRDGFIEGTDIIQLREYVYINTEHGASGTTENVGIATNPVNNITDAYTIALKKGIQKYRIEGDISLDRDYEDWKFESIISRYSGLLNMNGYATVHCEVNKLTLGGTGSSETIVAHDCLIDNLSGISGLFEACGILSCTLPGNGTTTSFIRCTSDVPGTGTPYIDLGAGEISNLQLRAYSGGMLIKNCDNIAENVSVDMISGHLKLDPSCTDGTLVARGAGYITDNSNGTNVVIKGLIGDSSMQAAYEGKVTIDLMSTYSGTGYPIGTNPRPVNNLIDAQSILETRGLEKIEVIGTLPIGATANVSGLSFIGINPLTSVVYLTPGCITTRCDFRNMILAGEVNGSIYGENIALDNISNLGSIDFPTVLNRCIIRAGTIALKALGDQNIHIIDSVCGDPGDNHPIIDMNGSVAPIAFRKFDGYIQLSNFSGGQISTYDSTAGGITLDASCTNGTLNISGLGELTDNSTLTVNNGYLDVTTLTNVINAMAADLARILGLSQHNFRIVDQTYSGLHLLSSTIKLYGSAADADTDTNPLYIYVMTATYDSEGRLTSYKMTEA